MTIVMGLDQHRAQITAEWVDADTGEIGRSRVAPAHRATVRRFLERFRGRRLEVALEARTGWRFVVEELERVGAVVHLAEPAETAERRGRKKRAKTDRADARLLRELVMTGRLPESWIAPEHILDLRARVRLRHTLVDQRGEWQQRIHAVLYHHGIPQRGLGLLTADGRAWLEGQRLPRTEREQVTVALAMIDKLDAQLAPYAFDLWMAREFAGCPFERYADDAVVHCKSRRQAEYVRARIAARMQQVGLRLHPDKTRIVYCKDSNRRGQHEHTSFTFLGYTFRPREARRKDGKQFTSFSPAISPEALKAKSDRLRGLRIHRHTDLSLDDLARWLNPIIAGWMNYYGRYYRSALEPLLQRVSTYLRRWARKKYKRLRTFKRFKRWCSARGSCCPTRPRRAARSRRRTG